MANISKMPKRLLHCTAFVFVASCSIYGVITHGTMLLRNSVAFAILYVLILCSQLIGEYYEKKYITTTKFRHLVFLSFIYLWAMMIFSCIYHMLGIKLEPSP